MMYIDPNIIKLRQLDEINCLLDGHVTPGDWDLPRNYMPFEDISFYKAFNDYLNGHPIEKTLAYERSMERVRSGQRPPP